jgi:hypothetical protein
MAVRRIAHDEGDALFAVWLAVTAQGSISHMSAMN